MESVPEIGSIHSYKGGQYEVVAAGSANKVKDPDSGVWHSGVTYKLLNPVDDIEADLRFTRQLSDFNRKFKEVADDCGN